VSRKGPSGWPWLAALLLIAVATLGLAACGGDDGGDESGQTAAEVEETTTDDEAAEGEGEREETPAGDRGDTVGPCELLADEAVDSRIGSDWSEDSDEQFGLSQCAWETHDPVVGEVAAAIYVTLGDASAFDDYVGTAADTEPVKGLGEEAVRSPGLARATGGSTSGSTLLVRTDERTAIVAWSLGGAPSETQPNEADLEELAREVLAAL
jgi:hypothetical protein